MALRVWLPFNGNLKNQGLSDNNITLYNTIAYSAGKLGQCIDFSNNASVASGSESLVTIPGLQLNNFTICAWVKVTSTATDDRFVAREGRGYNADGWNIRIEKNTNKISMGAENSYQIFDDTGTLNTWYHVTMVHSDDLSHNYWYLNGNYFFDVGGSKMTYDTTTGEGNSIVIGARTKSGSYHWPFDGCINDFRIYDECLSQKQIKEISKGLVAHYKLDSQFRSNRNIILGYYGTNSNSGWGAHRGTAVYTNDEDNSGLPFKKITKFTVTYDTSLGSGGGTSVYPPMTYNVAGGTQYTYSTYIKSEDNLTYMNANFLYRYEYDANGTKLTENGVCSSARKETIGNGWYRIWGTFTTQADTTKITLPFYTYCGKNNIYYLGGEQLELGDVMTPYIDETYNFSTNEIDCSGNKYNGNIIGSLKYNLDSPRYSGSTKFDGSTGCIAIGRPMPKDALTINAWAYMDNWASYNGRIGSCTEGGGWNFEPMSGAMNFALGVGASSNVYMTNFTSSQTPLSGLASGWHMFTGTFDGIYKRIYIDGVLKGETNGLQNGTTLTTATPIFYNGSNGIFIGAEAGGSATAPVGNYFNGSISDFRIYSTALSADDILTMYKNSGIIDNKGNVYAYEFKEE